MIRLKTQRHPIVNPSATYFQHLLHMKRVEKIPSNILTKQHCCKSNVNIYTYDIYLRSICALPISSKSSRLFFSSYFASRSHQCDFVICSDVFFFFYSEKNRIQQDKEWFFCREHTHDSGRLQVSMVNCNIFIIMEHDIRL